MLIKRKINLIVGIIIIIIGLFIGIIPFILERDNEYKDKVLVDNYLNDTSINNDISKDNNTDNTNSDNLESYFLVLEIPKIGLKRGVYDFNSKHNTIEENVSIMKESSLPNKDNGNVVLEAHSGSAEISYFNDLYKLNINDYAYIYYNGIKYKYKVNKIYDVDKDGDVEVYREKDKNTLTLITCLNDSDTKHLVVILYLEEYENY